MTTLVARCLAVICIMFLVTATATLGTPTAGSAGSATVIGAGTLSCSQWLTDRQGLHSAQDIEAWITGYLSGFDAYVLHGDITRGSNNDGLFAWIDDYCHAHPLDDVAVATDHLIDAFKAR
jgi:hypothetical protein